MTDNTLSITLRQQPSEHEVVADLAMGGESLPVYFQSSDRTLTPHAEAWLGFSLLPAMLTGSSIHLEAQVSRRFLNALPTMQDIYARWYPWAQRVEVLGCQSCERKAPAGAGVACFFSNGVDSWYTLLQHQDEITDLIFVHGLDVGLDNALLLEKTLEKIRLVADRFQKRLVVVKTNLRHFTDKKVPYLKLIGPAMFGVAHALSSHYRKVYLATSLDYFHLSPSGCHPLLDPLFGTEALEIHHDGCEADRFEKVAHIARSEIVLETLRVCWKNPQNEYNCGRCEKCVRTMLQLHAAGALENCTTFVEPLTPKKVACMRIVDSTRAYYAEANLQHLKARPDLRPYARALRQALRRYHCLSPLRKKYRLEREKWQKALLGLHCLLKKGKKTPDISSQSQWEYWKRQG